MSRSQERAWEFICRIYYVLVIQLTTPNAAGGSTYEVGYPRTPED
jgi:hypothetical protein